MAHVARGRQDDAKADKQFDEKIVNIDRVARVVKGGRRFRFRALVVVGDHKNQVGVGVAKGTDVTLAVTKATEIAKKNLVKLPITKGTLAHEVNAKVGGANVLLLPASQGTGLIAGGVVRTVLELGGVKNALSKSLGSNSKINIAYATVEALLLAKLPKDWNYNQTKPAKKAGEKAAKAEVKA